MPNGPNASGTRVRAVPDAGEWLNPPGWPPDLFCVAAALVEASGCYVESGLLFSRDDKERSEKRARAGEACKVGQEWRETGVSPALVGDLWHGLWRDEDEPVGAGTGHGAGWKMAALRLMAIADEACRDIGFLPADSPPNEPARTAIDAIALAQARRPVSLHLPASLCLAVPPDVACVLPKSLTPSVGCTLRSLSLNLALLPGNGAVGAEWYISTKVGGSTPASAHPVDGPFNLLLVPFPFDIAASDFVPAGPTAGGGADGYFGLRQDWLPPAKSRRARIAALVAALIRGAQAEGDEVHGVVLPETALAAGMAEPLAADLAATFPGLELLICGTLGQDADMGLNEAAVVRIEGGAPVGTLVQKKHHRWRLTASQIDQYRLGRTLPGGHDRWERIDVSGRCIQFGVNRQDAVVAALVCEDLARSDPVLPVVNAVGPNLVVALLMDGPQLLARWPGRYATVLAEDPGSSVLTLTSLGMLKRCRRPHEPVNRCIALWKDGDGDTRELVLPEGAHALLLCLRTSRVSQKTLDLRSEEGVVVYRFGSVRDVGLPAPPTFSWLAR